MSSLDVYNALQISDMQADSKTTTKVMELGQRAEFLQNTTGTRPESWYEYKRKNSEDLKLNPTKKALIGAAIGALIGLALITAISGGFASVAAIDLALPVISLAITGSLIGSQMEVARENNANAKLADGYNSYLDNFEQSHSPSRGVESSINYRDDHVARLKTQSSEITR